MKVKVRKLAVNVRGSVSDNGSSVVLDWGNLGMAENSCHKLGLAVI